MPGDEAFIKYFKEGGDIGTLATFRTKASPEFVTGEKRINLKLPFENGGEFSVNQNDKGILTAQITGSKGSIELIKAIKQKKNNFMLDNLMVIAPSYALNQLPNESLSASKYEQIKQYARIGAFGFFCIPSENGGSPFETFILTGEPIDPKIWMLILLHESGHAINIIDRYLDKDPKDPNSVSKRERESWAQALQLARIIKEKTGVDLFSIFSSKKELTRIIHSMLLAHRVAYIEKGRSDIADSQILFDKSRSSRLK